MYTGQLGPSTIIGSAAFNLLIISAICVAGLPKGEARVQLRASLTRLHVAVPALMQLLPHPLTLGPKNQGVRSVCNYSILFRLRLLVAGDHSQGTV